MLILFLSKISKGLKFVRVRVRSFKEPYIWRNVLRTYICIFAVILEDFCPYPIEPLYKTFQATEERDASSAKLVYMDKIT